MLIRAIALIAVILVGSSCGPEEPMELRTGLYRYESAVVENSCDPRFIDEDTYVTSIYSTGDRVESPHTGYLSGPDCEGCAPLASFAYQGLLLDPDDGLYHEPEKAPLDWKGCRHSVDLVGDVLDEGTLHTRIVDEWEDIGGCTAMLAGQDECRTVREYDYTLLEPCDDCSEDELRARRDEWTAAHPYPLPDE